MTLSLIPSFPIEPDFAFIRKLVIDRWSCISLMTSPLNCWRSLKNCRVENGDQLETITVSPGVHQMMIQGAPGQEPQVLQVVSLKDGTLLSKAVEVITSGNVKGDETIIMEQ
uniref:Nrf1_activ_bdg domain-containing protein n=1 Tax=Glossina austeni TaxID=7395 RepID=A0A1A9VWZ7_GLOAU